MPYKPRQSATLLLHQRVTEAVRGGREAAGFVWGRVNRDIADHRRRLEKAGMEFLRSPTPTVA